MEENFTGKSLLKFPCNFSVIQIETTDLNPNKDEITEIAVRKYRNNKLRDENSWNVTVHNAKKVLEEVSGLIAQDAVLINRTAFFCPFIGKAFSKYVGRSFSNNIIDIQRLFKKVEKQPTAKLDQMIKFYHLATPHHYRATNDINSVVEIYFKLQESFKQKYTDVKEIEPKADSKFSLKDIPGNPAKNDKNNLFFNKHVSATGKLRLYSREEFGQLINNIGGVFQKNPGVTTDYLVVGKLLNGSNKLKIGEKLSNIKVIYEDDFLKAIANYEWC